MKFDNKTFQQKYEAWKNGADYWKDIRGINLGGNTQAEEPSDEERQKVDREVQSILNAYNFGKDENDLQNYRGGKDDPINTFVSRMGPIVGQQLNRYGYGDTAYYNVMRQLAYESNYGRSRVARQQHNYGGVGFNGKTYASYKNDEDFVKNYVRLMHNKYDSALRAKSTQDYARALKQRGYYKDSLENYSRNLRGMDSLVKAAYNHRIRHRDAYNYNVSLKDLVQDYDDVKNSSPIVLNSMSVEQPSTIRADVPKTLIGPTREEVKAQQQKMLDEYRQKMYNQLTSTRLPNILNLLPQNNSGKDSYGQKFWLRRGNNLHFKGGKDSKSFNDWANKMSKYRDEFDVKDPSYWYRGFYNENPHYAYSMLNKDTDAHYNDHWKTPVHPTTSNQSYLTPLINAGRWFTFDNRDAYQEPFFDRSNPDERFWYLNMNENGGVVPFDKYGNMWRLDRDLYGGVLPAVQVIGKRGKK